MLSQRYNCSDIPSGPTLAPLHSQRRLPKAAHLPFKFPEQTGASVAKRPGSVVALWPEVYRPAHERRRELQVHSLCERKASAHGSCVAWAELKY
jgi:hypothetical protein